MSIKRRLIRMISLKTFWIFAISLLIIISLQAYFGWLARNRGRDTLWANDMPNRGKGIEYYQSLYVPIFPGNKYELVDKIDEKDLDSIKEFSYYRVEYNEGGMPCRLEKFYGDKKLFRKEYDYSNNNVLLRVTIHYYSYIDGIMQKKERIIDKDGIKDSEL